MPWFPLYLDEADAQVLLDALNADAEIAFIVANGPSQWVANKELNAVTEGRHCLWHHPSGPLPLTRASPLPSGRVQDPWAGWVEARAGADPTQPYFGAGHPGIVWWNLFTRSRERPEGIGFSSFEWIGNHYRVIGSAADPSTESWWKALRRFVKKQKAKRIPRSGPTDGVGPEVWAMPAALAKIESGMFRDANPT